jgi:tetratricopeptide (TPR) repeat protein
MKPLLTIFLLIVTLGCFAQETFNYQTDFITILAKTQDPKDKLAYENLLSRFSALDTTMTDYEVLALLIGFTENPYYNPFDFSTDEQIWTLYAKSKYKEAIDLGQQYLKTHPLSIKVLFGVAYSFQQLGQDSNARSYAYQVLRIFQAMRFSGYGTWESPMFSLGAFDGFDYINKFLNATAGKLDPEKDPNGNFLCILSAKFEDGQGKVFYFNIEHATRKIPKNKSE